MMYGGGDGQYISTTDMYSGCTSQHTGTSAAAPLVSGILALLLEKRPDLSYRDVQHLIVRSTIVNDPMDSDWVPNRAGRFVNHKYGFGLLHADRLIQKAETWSLIPFPLLSFQLPKDTEKRMIPTTPGQTLRVMKTVSLDHVQTLSFIEQIQVEVKIKHPQRGKLIIRLFSPEEGRSFSVLASARPHDLKSNGFQNWKFSTVRHWDESPLGNWTLEIEDTRTLLNVDPPSLIPGYLESWSMKFIGRCSDEDTYVDTVTNTKKCWLEKPKPRTVAIIEERSTSMYFLGLFSGWFILLFAWSLRRCFSYFYATFKPYYPVHMESTLLLHAEEGEAELKKKRSGFGETDPNLNDTTNPQSPLLKTVRLPNQDHPKMTQRSATSHFKYNSNESGEGQGSLVMVQNLVELEKEGESVSNPTHSSSIYATSSPRSLTLGSGDFKMEKEEGKELTKAKDAPVFTLKNLNPLPKLDPSSIHSTASSNEQEKT